MNDALLKGDYWVVWIHNSQVHNISTALIPSSSVEVVRVFVYILPVPIIQAGPTLRTGLGKIEVPEKIKFNF